MEEGGREGEKEKLERKGEGEGVGETEQLAAVTRRRSTLFVLLHCTHEEGVINALCLRW